MKTNANNALEAIGQELFDYVESTGVMTEPDLSFPLYQQWYTGEQSFRDYLMEIVGYRLSLAGKFVPAMYGDDGSTTGRDTNNEGEPE